MLGHLIMDGFLVFVVFFASKACLGCCLGLGLFSVFCFLFPFASLHALALSLTGAHRTDSSSEQKRVESIGPLNLEDGRRSD